MRTSIVWVCSAGPSYLAVNLVAVTYIILGIISVVWVGFGAPEVCEDL